MGSESSLLFTAMRQIKFRCVKDGNIFHNEQIMNDSPIGKAFIKVVFNKCEMIETPLDDFEKSLIWEEYTGLCDKKGVEIYEGDVVRVWGGVEHQGCFEYDKNCVIRLERGAFVARSKGCIGYLFCNIEEHEIEIIGNIHHHKHLLT